MSLIYSTAKPKTLLAKIKDAIDKGAVKTWTYDNDGDFTHVTSGEQWAGRGWLRPTVVEKTSLNFKFIQSSNQSGVAEVYAIYHGRFTEMMLAHFSEYFISCETWPM
jgi:hypothetical protein